MKKSLKFLSAAALCVATVACSSPKKMAEMAENVIVTCEPAVLEIVAGEIKADVTVTYPADYFHPKAVLEVTPVLVYEGGEKKMAPYYFQGSKVKDNYEVVPEEGSTVTKPVHFEYQKGMEKCYLELRGVVSYKGDNVDLPVKKAADGAVATYLLVEQKGKLDLKADGYQEIIKSTAEGQILYQINNSTVRSNQLKSQSIKDFQAAVDAIKANERKAITSTDIVAYASPDGAVDLNEKLSDNRSKSAEKAFSKISKGHEIDAPVNVESIGEDWEGFQELVAASDIEDKDLIIRVLSMYSDPAVREKEIKNMSAVYKTLAKEVLPELRRARFIANVEYTNYTSEELLKLIDENIDVLDETALLRAATLVKDNNDKIAVYKKAIEKYNSAAAKYNTAVVYLDMDNIKEAKAALAKCEKDADVENALGVIELRGQSFSAAEKHFKASGNETAKENNAVVDILLGKYKDAAAKLAGKTTFNANLAQYLVGNYAAVNKADESDLRNAYLKATVAAKQGKANDVKKYLKLAGEDKDLAERAAKDIEFAQYR